MGRLRRPIAEYRSMSPSELGLAVRRVVFWTEDRVTLLPTLDSTMFRVLSAPEEM